MSRSRKIEDAAARTESARHDRRHVRRRVDLAELAARVEAGEGPVRVADGDERLQAWHDEAIAELAAAGLPTARRIWYDPTREGLPLLGEDAVAAIRRDGLRARIAHGVEDLPAYLVRRGFGPLDDEVLLAEIVVATGEAMDERLDMARRLDGAIDATHAVATLDSLRARDVAASGRGRATKARPYEVWVRPLARLLVRRLPDATDKERWADIPDEPADMVVFDATGAEWIVYRATDTCTPSRERLRAYRRDDETSAHAAGPTFRTFADYFMTPLKPRS